MLPDFRLHHQEYLIEILRGILEELDLERLLARLIETTVAIAAGSAGVVLLREESGWYLAAVHGFPMPYVRLLETLVEDVPLHSSDPVRYELPELLRRLEWLTHVPRLGLAQGLGMPLIARGELLGLLYVYRSYRSLFTQEDFVRLRLFAEQAAIAVHNARLYTRLHREKQRMDALLDAVADGIFILDAEYRLERVNPAFARMYGADREALVGRSHREVIRWKRIERGLPLEEALVQGWPYATREPLYVQGDLERPSGKPLPVGITYAPLFDESGQALLNVIASARDIRAFREADRLKAVFISTISHELKTPIALIKGYVGTLRRPDLKPDAALLQEALQVIEEEADRLARLVQDLLDASRMQAGALQLRCQDVDLRALIERIVQRFARQYPDYTFDLAIPEDVPLLRADEARLEQVLTNLLSNAVKYAPARTTVQVQAQVLDREVVVCVADQGPGIAPEDRAHVFDPFFRSPHTEHKPGVGLGLYLARAVVEAHGGRIWVDPHYTQGARICFALPLRGGPCARHD